MPRELRLDLLRPAIERLRASSARATRVLHPLEALDAAIERLRACALVPDAERELVEVAAHDVIRAIVQARRWLRELEHEGLAVMDLAAQLPDDDGRCPLGVTGRLP
jgi:hypothetical protein